MTLSVLRLALVVICLLFCLVTTDVRANEANKSLQQIGLNEGLSQGDVTAFLQDHEGFIWIGTHQGLNLYDGYTIRPLKGPGNILQLQRIDALHQDNQKNVWVGSLPNRNFVINKSTGQIKDVNVPFEKDYDAIDSGFTTIAAGENQDIWLLTYQAVFHYPNQAIDWINDNPVQLDGMRFDMSPYLNGSEIIRSAIDISGHLFVGTSNGLFRVNKADGTVTFINFLANQSTKDSTSKRDDRLNVKGLVRSSDQHLLISTVEGLYRITLADAALPAPANSKQETPLLNLASEVLEAQLNVWQVIEEDDFLWLATNDGLYKWQNFNKQLQIRFSDTPYEIIDNNIQELMRDEEGNLWLSSRNDGAFLWRPINAEIDYLQAQNDGSGLSNNMVWSIKQDQRGQVWVGTDNGLNKVDVNDKTVQQLYVNQDKKARISEATVYDIEPQGDSIWVARQDGLTQINVETNEPVRRLTTPAVDKLLKTPAYDIHMLDDERMFVINTEGVFIYNTATDEVVANEQNDPNQSITDQLQRVMHYDATNNELLISKADELVRYSVATGQQQVVHALPPSDQPRTIVEGVYTTSGSTWISYPGFGIYVIDNQTGEEIKHLTIDDGLPDNSPYNFIPDEEGYIWVTSNSGLARIDQESFHVRVFKTQHGLASNEFNGGAVLVDRDGQFWLGGVKGVHVFDPVEFSNTTKAKHPIHNHITRVNLLSRPLPSRFGIYRDYEIELSHEDFGLELDFSALHYSNIGQVKYQYFLEGAATTPPKVINTNHLLLPKLEVGTSVIKISAIDYETGAISPPESLTIKVSPAPYLSWWAYSLYIAVIVSIGVAFFWQNQSKQRAMAAANADLQASEKRLQLALTGSGSGMWEWLSQTNQVFDPRVGEKSSGHFVPLSDKFQRIHHEDLENYNASWQRFISSKEEVFEAIYRMKVDDKWLWFRDLARATKVSEGGDVLRVSGTYTDISEIKDSQDKIILFSEAFQATRDSVVITDDHLNVVDANQAFFSLTGFAPEEVIGKTPSFIYGEQQDMELLTKIVFNLMAHDSWEGEANLACANSVPAPVIVNTTKFKTNSSDTRFVFALTDIFKQKLAEAELKKQANYDSLTGLPNRALLSDRVKHAIGHHKQSKQMFAICFIDLDNFKQINDTLGHDVGDELLKDVAQILKMSVRDYDSVARLGGDEFVLVIEELTNLDVVHRIAQKIIDAMANMSFAVQYPIKSSPSIGIATFPADGTSSQELMKNADTAMYHAKRLGRNNFQFFENKMNEDAHAKLILENQIKDALEQDRFSLVYQPKICLASGEIIGFEALARWQQDDGSFVPPGIFIPVLEEMGLIIQLTEKLLDVALEDLKRFIAVHPEMSIALNFSAKHLQNYDLPSYLHNKVKQAEVAPRHLEIELTETVLMDDIGTALNVCQKISDLGFNIALDDFGTGYSSFKYLSQLPINTLKIDRSFVWKIGDEQGDTIIDSILGLAKKLGICVVAEGIETKQQLKFLKALECDKGQGFYFAKPLKFEECLSLLENPTRT